MPDIPGSIRIPDTNGHADCLPPPNDDGQRYVLIYDFTQTRPAWHGLGGFGLSYGSNYGGGLT